MSWEIHKIRRVDMRELEFDYESLVVICDNKTRQFTFKRFLDILRVLYNAMPNPVTSDELLAIGGYASITSLRHAFMVMKKTLGPNFPYELKNQHGVGYMMIARK